VVFKGAIDYVMNNPKVRQNPRALSQLDGYKRGPGEVADRRSSKIRLQESLTHRILEQLFQDGETTLNLAGTETG
jgi:hypothetical protein